MKIKNTIVLLAFIVSALTSNAQITLNSFEIANNYLQNNTLKVANINTSTPFKFYFVLTRGLQGGGYYTGNCQVSLIYTEYASSDGHIEPDNSEITIYSKSVTSSDYKYETANFIDLDGTLPANKTNGKIILKYVYADYSNVTRTIYSTTRYNITVLPPIITPTESLYPFPSNYSNRSFNYTEDNPSSTYTSIQMSDGTPILMTGQSLYSPNNKYRLYLQSDGNLVLYRKESDNSETGIWNSQTNGKTAGNLYFQTDGNLVIYGLGNSPSNPAPGIWASNINGTSTGSINNTLLKNRPYLALQNDGNLVIYWPQYRSDIRTKVNIILAATDTNNGSKSTHQGNLNSFLNAGAKAGSFFVSSFF